MKKVINCENCNKRFEREEKEIKRSLALGRRQFCSRRCSGLATNNESTIKQRIPKNIRDIAWTYARNRKKVDEKSPFRYYVKLIKNRQMQKCLKMDIGIDYLISLWEKQQGICPLTGWKLDLPHGSAGWMKSSNTQTSKRASLDRIDNMKGYIVGNVRFVSVMANYARNNMSDKALVEFCKAVSAKHQ